VDQQKQRKRSEAVRSGRIENIHWCCLLLKLPCHYNQADYTSKRAAHTCYADANRCGSTACRVDPRILPQLCKCPTESACPVHLHQPAISLSDKNVLESAKVSVQTARLLPPRCVVECIPEPEVLRAGPLIHLSASSGGKNTPSLDRNQQVNASSPQPSQQYSASQTIHSSSSTPLHHYPQERNQISSQAKVRVSSFRGERCSCRCMTSSLRRTVWTKVSNLSTSLRQG
jgi:hypothetical protein